MPDGNRVYPVDILVLHHAVSDEMYNLDDGAVSQWFNDTGRNRGYAGVAHSGHVDPDTKQETFAQAHWCLHKYDKDGNPYGWRLTLLIDDPDNSVAWHAGNWAINQRSYGVETAGIYLDHPLPEGALRLLADFFRPTDRDLVNAGHPDGLQVFGHRYFYTTQCPGQIYDQIPHLIDLMNEEGSATPAPSPTPEPEKWSGIVHRITPLTFQMREGIPLIDLSTMQPVPGNEAVGGTIVVAAKSDVYQGTTYYFTQYSLDKLRPTGFREQDLYKKGEEVAAVQPALPPTPPTAPDAPQAPVNALDDNEVRFIKALHKAAKEAA